MRGMPAMVNTTLAAVMAAGASWPGTYGYRISGRDDTPDDDGNNADQKESATFGDGMVWGQIIRNFWRRGDIEEYPIASKSFLV